MAQGRLRLSSGLTVNCSYELSAGAENEGRLGLFPALYSEFREGDGAMLILDDGAERPIRLSGRLNSCDASFHFIALHGEGHAGGRG